MMVNRGALLLRYKQPAIHWITAAEPYPSDHVITMEEVNKERTVYLISDTAGDSPESLVRWLKRNFAALFEEELSGWYTDPELWPKNRTYKLFCEWFAVECHTLVVDFAGGELVDDET